MRVVFCDADAYDAGYIETGQIAGRVKVIGRGGTRLQPAVDLFDRILLFDEPTSGLDFAHMKKTEEMIKEIARDKTVFVITHDMELVDECCTHILKLGGNNITGK